MKSVDVFEFHFLLSQLLEKAQSKEDVLFIQETLIDYMKFMCKNKMDMLKD